MSRDMAEIMHVATSSAEMITLPARCSGVWLRIVMSMVRGQSSAIRLRGRDLTDATLARLAALDVDDVTDCLDPLLQADLLRREEDGSLTAPLLVAQTERRRLAAERRAALQHAVDEQVEAAAASGVAMSADDIKQARIRARNQANGRYGGRPRKDGSPPTQRKLGLLAALPSGTQNPDRNPVGFAEKPRSGETQNPLCYSPREVLPTYLPKEDERNQIDRQTGSSPHEETQKPSKTQNPETQIGETQNGLALLPGRSPVELPVQEQDRVGCELLAIGGRPRHEWAKNSRGKVTKFLRIGVTPDEMREWARDAMANRRSGTGGLGLFERVFEDRVEQLRDRLSGGDAVRDRLTAEGRARLGADEKHFNDVLWPAWKDAGYPQDKKPIRPRPADYLELGRDLVAAG